MKQLSMYVPFRCRTRRILVLLLGIGMFTPLPSLASYIRLLGTPNLTFTVEGDLVHVIGTYEMLNEGDEQARAVFPHLSIGAWSWAGDEKNLESNQKATWQLDTTFPVSLLNCEQSELCAGQNLPAFGSHPLAIKRHYQSINGTRYTAAEVNTVTIGTFEGNKLVAIRAPSLTARVDLDGDGQRFEGNVLIQNLDKAPKTLAVALFAPQEFKSLSKPQTVQIGGLGDASVKIELENFTGLTGSSYAIFVVMQWEELGLRVSSITSAAAAITPPDRSMIPVIAVLSALLVSLLLLYVFVLRRPKTP